MNWDELRGPFGDHLKRLMVSRGLSDRRLAALSGLSRVTIVRLQGKEVDPRLSTLIQYASALGVTFRDLFEPFLVGDMLTEDDKLLDVTRKLLREPKIGAIVRSFIRSLNPPV